MERLAINSYAKLNLYLEVVNKRKDGYHNIKTLFERIDLSDKIVLKSRRDKKINIICRDPCVPRDSSNLCYRSARLLQEKFDIDEGLDILITKRIPVGAGLGGGSSNAAAVLLGLNRLWRLKLSRDRLIELAKKIGCDVPFFVFDAPFAEGSSRGDEIKSLGALNNVRLWHILVVPKVSVSTPLIYSLWDRHSGLTRAKYDVKIVTLALRKHSFSLASGVLFNSLESITRCAYPEVSRAREKLERLGLKSILMSGSGPAVFGIVSSRKEALSLRRKLRKQSGSLRIYVTSTFSR